MPLLRPEELEAFKRGALLLNCQRMELRGTPSDPEKLITGAGYISQVETGDLSFTLFDTTFHDDEVFGWTIGANSVAGALIPLEAYSRLTAYDSGGRVWQSTCARASFSHVVSQPGIVWRGRLTYLETVPEQPRDHTRWLWMYFPTSADIVTNEYTVTESKVRDKISKNYSHNVWIVNTGELNIHATKVDGGIEVKVESANSGGSFPNHADTRIEEALWLVLSRLVAWTVLYRGVSSEPTIHLRRRPFAEAKPRLSPPIELSFEHEGNIGALFGKYLQHILTHVEPTYHPTSADLRMVLSASALTVEQEALQLCVAVEAMLSREFPQLGLPDKSVSASVDDLTKCIEEWSGNEKIRDRALGLIRRLKEQNPRTALRDLVSKGVITRTHYDAWTSLRNPAAHGKRMFVRPFETATLCDGVYQLLVLLLAQVIGFQGYVNDRTVLGWPLLPVPLDQNKSSSPHLSQPG